MSTEYPRFSSDLLTILQKSGWFPNRDVLDTIKFPQDFVIFPSAQNILREFGNLHIEGSTNKHGAIVSTPTIIFDPMLAYGENDRFIDFENILQHSLYPLGEVNRGYHFLSIDTSNRIFLLMNDLYFVADSIEYALERLLLKRTRPFPLVNDDGTWEK